MPNLQKLENQAYNHLLAREAKYSKLIQKQLLEALTSIYGEMKRIYDKYAINGKLTKAEMTKYNKYSTMEEQILKRLDPALKKNVKTIQKLLPEQFQQSFFHYAWAMDNATELRLSYGVVNTKSLLGAFDITNPKNVELIEALKNYGPTAKKRIRAALLDGLSLGKSFEVMAKDLKKALNKTYSDAIRIVRTEGMTAINSGQALAYNRAIENGVKGKEIWNATRDQRTRIDHRHADGKERDKEGYFNVGGEKALYPGDPNLTAGNRINCIPEYAIPIGFNVEKLYKRYYEGNLINIKTSSGLELSITPNHPILTDHGWIAANLINESSNIICVDFGKKINRFNHNINYRPPMINKIFDLFRIMTIKQRVFGTKDQFHGDGENSDINIESFNGQLWNSFESAFYKPLIKNVFSFSNILACFLSSFGSLNKFLFRTFHSTNGIVRGLRKFLSFFWGSLFHSSKHGFTSISGSDVIFKEPSPDNLTRDIKITCERFFRSPVIIFSDKVISINNFSYSGYVYNLQTKDGYYGIYNDNGKMSIVHNCRCTIRFEIEGYEPQLMRTREEGIIPYQTYDDYSKQYHPDWIDKTKEI